MSATKTRVYKLLPHPHVIWPLVKRNYEEFCEYEGEELAILRKPDYHDDEWWEDYEDENYVYDEPELVIRPFRGLSILMGALAHTGARLESFYVCPHYEIGTHFFTSDNFYAGLSHWYFQEWCSELTQMAGVFQRLRRLNLVLHSETEEYGRRTVQCGHLRQVLNSAELLEELRLELHPLPVMDALDSIKVYPKLKKLQIIYGIVDPLMLFEFLSCNQASLKSLALYGCDSPDARWERLFYAMRDNRVNLRDLTIYMLAHPGEDGVPPHKDQPICASGRHRKEAIDVFLLRSGPYPFVPYDPCNGTPLAGYIRKFDFEADLR